MYELHGNEQYFFDDETLDWLAMFLGDFSSPACLCAPLLGQSAARRGVNVRILDIDRRFESTPGFRHFDIQRPEWLGEAFDLILCDPPFYNVSLSRLFAALRLLSRNDFSQRLMVSYLVRRSSAVLGTFARFGLTPSGYRPQYKTVKKVDRNEIEFFTNLEPELVAKLRRERRLGARRSRVDDS